MGAFLWTHQENSISLVAEEDSNQILYLQNYIQLTDLVKKQQKRGSEIPRLDYWISKRFRFCYLLQKYLCQVKNKEGMKF